MGIAADYVTGMWENSAGELFKLKDYSLAIKQLKISVSKLSDQIDIMPCEALIDLCQTAINEKGQISICLSNKNIQYPIR